MSEGVRSGDERPGAGAERISRLVAEAARHHDAGQLEDAKRLYLEILALNVRHAPSLHGLGLIAQQYGNFDVARNMMRRAIAADPKNLDYRFAVGVVLQAKGDHDDALSAFREVLQLDADHLQARFRTGNVLQMQGRLEEAIAEYSQILKIRPDAHDAEFNIGNVRRLQGRLPEARERYMRSLKIQPGNVDALWNLSLLDLLEGHYAAGWPNYEIRHRRLTPGLRAFDQPQWTGEPLKGRILIHAEQGLGDTLQFLRYLPMVAEAGLEVLLDVPGTVRRLAEGIAGVSAVITTGDAIPPFDVQCPLMSLALTFRTTLDSIPAHVPYLTVPKDAQRAAAERAWPEHGLRVGIVWGATPRRFEDSDRSIPLPLFRPLLGSGGAHFFSLQVGPSASRLKAISAPVTDLHHAIEDFADTAAFISRLDLVITVDTSVAHLAGALGKPTWILLPFAADWRWLTDRADSPWYPTVRLFRQPRPGDWHSVMEQVCGALAPLAEHAGR
jgi:Flp pilus assembly protein TadD